MLISRLLAAPARPASNSPPAITVVRLSLSSVCEVTTTSATHRTSTTATDHQQPRLSRAEQQRRPGRRAVSAGAGEGRDDDERLDRCPAGSALQSEDHRRYAAAATAESATRNAQRDRPAVCCAQTVTRRRTDEQRRRSAPTPRVTSNQSQPSSAQTITEATNPTTATTPITSRYVGRSNDGPIHGRGEQPEAGRARRGHGSDAQQHPERGCQQQRHHDPRHPVRQLATGERRAAGRRWR